MCFLALDFEFPSYHVDQSHLYAFSIRHPGVTNAPNSGVGLGDTGTSDRPTQLLVFTYLRNGALSTDIPLGPAETANRWILGGYLTCR